VIVKIQPCLYCAVLFAVLTLSSVAKAQFGPSNPGPEPTHTATESEETQKMKKDMAKKANKQRQADLQRDTEKLFKLATELKDYVGKTNENIMSLGVMKKAEEIEKLAHDVKEKMKNSY
jgi:spore coat polysaccharide biosynthesis protein SpsF (cytidylyltransferase family)